VSIVRPGLEQIDPGAVADGTYAVVVASGTITSLSAIGINVAAIVAGSNVTVDNTDPANPVVSATGPRELLMADGVTSPPVPIENEAGDDWLYQD
jgi:hypothetical protein